MRSCTCRHDYKARAPHRRRLLQLLACAGWSASSSTAAGLKQQPGPDLHVWGSGNLIQTLIRHDLVDAFWLMIYPVTLGAGKRLFADGTMPAAFKVTESNVTLNGVIVVNYERAGAIVTGS